MAHERAGQPAAPEDLVDLAHLVTAYYTIRPDPENPLQQVAFGTSGHRGSSLDAAFNEQHILATTQPSSNTAQRRARPDRCSWVATHTRCPSPPGRPRSRS